MGVLADMSAHPTLRFFDKDTYPVRPTTLADGVRIVPGGSSIRDGAYVAPGVVCMPPMYVNVGAYVDHGSMIDSHALVGSCAQVGKRVHLSAAAQIGGVLEPVGALPVIIEDEAMVGGGCGVYEGTLVRERAVLAPGTILTGRRPCTTWCAIRCTAGTGTGHSRFRLARWSYRARAARRVPRRRDGDLRLRAGDRKVSGREDRRRDFARGVPAMKQQRAAYL